MRDKELLRPVKRKRCWTTDSNHPYPRFPNLVRDLEISKPDQVWVSDATYIRLGKGFVYLAAVMDVFTRSIRGWELSTELDQQMTISALQKGLHDHCPEIHHSDQGVQYAARAYVDILNKNEIKVSMSDPGQPTQNGYAERLMRTIKEEEVELAEYSDFMDAKKQIGRFIEDVYQHKRIHSALGYLTPVEFEAAFLLFQVPPKESV